MSVKSIQIQLPEPLLRRFREAAEENAEPIETVLVQALEANPPPLSLDHIPPPAREAVRRLRGLSEDDLWRVARDRISADEQAHLEQLLTLCGEDDLTVDERQEMDAILDRIDVQNVVKAYAYNLLRWHGHALPPVEALHLAK